MLGVAYNISTALLHSLGAWPSPGLQSCTWHGWCQILPLLRVHVRLPLPQGWSHSVQLQVTSLLPWAKPTRPAQFQSTCHMKACNKNALKGKLESNDSFKGVLTYVWFDLNWKESIDSFSSIIWRIYESCVMFWSQMTLLMESNDTFIRVKLDSHVTPFWQSNQLTRHGQFMYWRCQISKVKVHGYSRHSSLFCWLYNLPRVLKTHSYICLISLRRMHMNF